MVNEHIETLMQELRWFSEVLDTRLKLYFGHECAYTSIHEVTPPDYGGDSSAYARFIAQNKSTPTERLVLALTLAPHLQPQLLDVFCVKNATYDKGFTEFGGLKGITHGGFLPTAETALFVAAADDVHQRMAALTMFHSANYLFRQHVIQLHEPAGNEPYLSGMISLATDWVNYFTTGQHKRPVFSKEFPARLLTTGIDWDELVLPEDILLQIEEIRTWIRHQHTLLYEWGFHRKLKPGFKSLFYGPPGTGKTLVACLIGKACSMDVYRIDLSTVVSKYIGETEKNLEKIFTMAENKNWILFFDEADALFGKRTNVGSSHDRYANQETAYLLQRIEDFNGLVVLATNLRSNIDEAFARRFQSVIYFPVPQPEERLRLWEQSWSTHTCFEEGFDLQLLAYKHQLTGGMILNVTRYCSLMALSRGENIIRMRDAENGIERELLKEGRMM